MPFRQGEHLSRSERKASNRSVGMNVDSLRRSDDSPPAGGHERLEMHPRSRPRPFCDRPFLPMLIIGHPGCSERFIDQRCASPIPKRVPLKSALAIDATARASRRPFLQPSYLHSKSRNFRPGFGQPRFRGRLRVL